MVGKTVVIQMVAKTRTTQTKMLARPLSWIFRSSLRLLRRRVTFEARMFFTSPPTTDLRPSRITLLTAALSLISFGPMPFRTTFASTSTLSISLAAGVGDVLGLGDGAAVSTDEGAGVDLDGAGMLGAGVRSVADGAGVAGPTGGGGGSGGGWSDWGGGGGAVDGLGVAGPTGSGGGGGDGWSDWGGGGGGAADGLGVADPTGGVGGGGGWSD